MLSTAVVARRTRLQQLAGHPLTPAATRRRIERAIERSIAATN